MLWRMFSTAVKHGKNRIITSPSPVAAHAPTSVSAYEPDPIKNSISHGSRLKVRHESSTTNEQFPPPHIAGAMLSATTAVQRTCDRTVTHATWDFICEAVCRRSRGDIAFGI